MNRISPFNIVAGTHAGLVRSCNEDSYIYSVDEYNPNSLVIVADGIGGHDRGDLASKICTKNLFQAWNKRKMASDSSEEMLMLFLKEEIKKANEHIYRLNKSMNIQNPMGTTLVSGIIGANKLFVAHAGDSRLYRLRDGKINCLTEDHSFIAELIKRKIISSEESRNHPFAHIISKSIGTTISIEPDFNTYDVKSGDRLLFCTDGLNIHLEDQQIGLLLEDASDPNEAVKNLVYAALRSGGEDNITVVCVFI
ncbi:MAG TPA: Stp1/IreP family PP2C-type Ser/Thr phosphatase [Victivallales bacterium]|nr:Stp1/IreP family PP2C-type Ser/Thr phosphatase [Victivallales bacterium]